MIYRAPEGTELAYRVAGRGRAMVLTNGLTTTGSFWKYLQPHWQAQHRVLSWDLPGHGASGPAQSRAGATLVGQVPSLVGLMDAADMTRAIQVGWSTGCQVVLELYRRHPERCAALVLLLGSAGNVLSNSQLPGAAIDWAARKLPAPVFAGATRALARAGDTPVSRVAARAVGLVGWGTSRADAREITRHLRRLDPGTLQTMVASAEDQSAWALLPRVGCPVLVVAGDRDPFAPAERVGVRMAGQIPQATLVRLPKGSHTAMLDHASQIRAAVDGFVQGLSPEAFE